MNFFQYRCELVASVPRVWCRQHAFLRSTLRTHIGISREQIPAQACLFSHMISRQAMRQRLRNKKELSQVRSFKLIYDERFGGNVHPIAFSRLDCLMTNMQNFKSATRWLTPFADCS